MIESRNKVMMEIKQGNRIENIQDWSNTRVASLICWPGKREGFPERGLDLGLDV